MVSNHALQRTLKIRFGANQGTAFTLDIDGRQYLITARHVVEAFAAGSVLQLFHDGGWKDLQCSLVGHAPGDTDVAVLSPQVQISPALPLNPSSGVDLFLSQDVYFLGFPYGQHAELGSINYDLPLPLVKKACVSLVSPPGPNCHLLLDGHNNPGFSGGPVVFSPIDKPNDMRVAGVVSAFQFVWDKVYMANQETNLTTKYNTGIVVAYHIQHALDLIKANPIGLPLNVGP